MSLEPGHYQPSYPPAPYDVDAETEQIVWRRPEPVPIPVPESEVVGLDYNGFHVDEGHGRFAELFAGIDAPRPRHRLNDGSEPHRPRHYREEDDDAETYGRHVMPRRD